MLFAELAPVSTGQSAPADIQSLRTRREIEDTVERLIGILDTMDACLEDLEPEVADYEEDHGFAPKDIRNPIDQRKLELPDLDRVFVRKAVRS